MKKYLLFFFLLLSSLQFFSCKEEKIEEESKGISGVYTSTLTGQYSSVEYKYENNKMLFVFSRRNNSEYIYITDTIQGTLVTSPISIINVSDSNKIKGDFYLYGISSGWVRGSIDGIVSRDSIYGSFTGHIPYHDPLYHYSVIYPIENGRFTLKYKSQLSH